MTLDTKDVLLVFISLAVSLCASWVANLSTPSLASVFHKRRLRLIERRQDRALSTYVRIWEMHAGKIDKYLFFLHQLLLAQVAGTLIVGGMVMHYGATIPGVRIIGLVVFVGATSFVLMSMFRFALWKFRLEHFDQYTKDFEAKFGKPNMGTTEA